MIVVFKNKLQIKNHEVLKLTMDLPICLPFVYKNWHSTFVKNKKPCNSNIKISSPTNDRHQPFHSLDWPVTIPEMEKVTRNIQLKMVGFPPLMLQTNHIYRIIFLCLSLTLVLRSEIVCLNWIPSFSMLMLCNTSPKNKNGRL